MEFNVLFTNFVQMFFNAYLSYMHNTYATNIKGVDKDDEVFTI